MGSKVLITGINGFVASYLIEQLSDFEIFGTYRDEEEQKSNNAKKYKAELTDYSSILKVVEKTNPDYIFHLAGIGSVGQSLKNPELAFKVNTEGTANVVKAIKKVNKKIKLLFTSTSQVYDTTKNPITEKTKLKPLSPYAESKLKAEQYVQELENHVIFRSFSHIGPGQHPELAISSFAKQIAEIEKDHNPVIKVGNLAPKRDFADVRDVAMAYKMAMDSHGTFNVCSGNAYSIQELLNMLISFSDKEIKVEIDKERLRPNDIPLMLGDNSKLRKETGWKPEIKIEKTLKDILDYWRERV